MASRLPSLSSTLVDVLSPGRCVTCCVFPTLCRGTERLRGGSDPKHVLRRFTVLLPNARGASKETLDSDAAERRHPLPLFLPPLGLKIAMIAVASLSRVSSDSSRA